MNRARSTMLEDRYAADPAALARLQRRTLGVVVASQVLGGAGLAAGITVGALLAQEMLGSDGLAGMPAALFTLGSAAAAYLVGRVSQRRGRRVGLGAGFAAGALGAVGVVVAAVTGNVVLLFVSLLVYGAGTATNLQARYAGTDLAAPRRRATAVSIAMVSTTLGAVAGPNLVEPLGVLAVSLGIPALAGPFLLAAVAFGSAGLVLFVLLRPDPLLVARRVDLRGAGAAGSAPVAAAPPEAGAASTTPAAGTAPVAAAVDSAVTTAGPQVSPSGGVSALAAPGAQASPSGFASGPGAASSDASAGSRPRGPNPGVMVGATVMVLTQIAMVAIMTMTPVHMRTHGHGLGAVGLVIGMHVAAMFLPSLVTGILVDRVGRIPMAVAAAVTLLLAGLVAATAPADNLAFLIVALVLLGLGWNFGVIAGTALIVDAGEPSTRARTQGTVDVLIALAGAGGGAASGLVVAGAGFSALAIAGGALALLLLPVLAWARRKNTVAVP